MIKNWQKENKTFAIILVVLCSILLAFLMGLQINLIELQKSPKIKEVPVISPEPNLLQDKYLRLPDEERDAEKI